MLFALHKAAPGSDTPPRPVFKTSHDALGWARKEHLRKAGLADVEGHRDDENQQIGPQTDKTVRALAQSLVNQGRFTDIETALRFMRGSAVYASLFKPPRLFGEGRRDMLAAR